MLIDILKKFTEPKNILIYNTFDKTTYYSLLIFAFIIPLSKAAISFFLFWFFFLLLYKRDYKNSFEILKNNSIFLYIALFLSYMYLSLLWSEDIKEGLNQARLYTYWVLLLPAVAILTKKEWLDSILKGFLLGMFISEILAYGIFFDLWSINDATPNYPTPFMTHIHYSIFLAFTSLVLLHKVLSQNSSLYAKLPYLLFFFITTTNLMFSTGRAGQLAFFCSLVILIFLKYKVSLKSIAISLVSVMMIFFVAYSNLDLFKKRADAAISDIEHISNQNYQNSFGIRVLYWIITAESLKEKPLFGEGIGDFTVAAKKAVNENNFGLDESGIEFLTTQHYHNQYLMVATQGGLVGLFLMFLLFLGFFRLKIKDMELKEISILGISVILVGFIAEPLWMLQFPNTLFLFIASISIVASKDNFDTILKTKEPKSDE
ncbi:MAG: O-antigen ligase family protein [Sulfurimonas sp.]|uniref:O-antigen ligase family protein n=1 Tax=Sulfurimonas sp. TaxID=2022749 RepID=UPI003D1353F3